MNLKINIGTDEIYPPTVDDFKFMQRLYGNEWKAWQGAYELAYFRHTQKLPPVTYVIEKVVFESGNYILIHYDTENLQ